MSTGQPATKLNEAKHCACACGSLRLGQNECSTRTVGVTELTWFSACGELQLELVSGSVQLLELQKQTRKSEDHKELNLSRFIYIYIYTHTYIVCLYLYIYIFPNSTAWMLQVLESSSRPRTPCLSCPARRIELELAWHHTAAQSLVMSISHQRHDIAPKLLR